MRKIQQNSLFGDDKLFLLLLFILMLLFFYCVQLSLFCSLEWKCTTVKCLQILLLIPNPLHLVLCITPLKLTVGSHLTLNFGIHSIAKLFFFSASCVCWLISLGCEDFKIVSCIFSVVQSQILPCCPASSDIVQQFCSVNSTAEAVWNKSCLHTAVVWSFVAFRMCRTGWVTIPPAIALWKPT